MIRDTGGHFYFSSEHAWLSNFYPSTVNLQGMTFSSAEQAYQYIKARRNGEPDRAKLILRAKGAKEAKNIGKDVHLKPTWDLH